MKKKLKRKRPEKDVASSVLVPTDAPQVVQLQEDLEPFQGQQRKSKKQRIWREVVASETAENGFHNYKVDPLDHAETDTRAYMHLKPCLQLVANHLSKSLAQLGLWDPYFCKGGMVKRLAGLGFEKVHNVNEDFYAVIKSGTLPDYDVIISSPPYSGDHLERCLRFCASQKHVWCLLLPNWVESRPYFREVLGDAASRVFYISPVQRYTYWMPPDLVTGSSRPAWVGQDGGTSPYDSTWFVHLPARLPRKKIFAALERHQLNKREWVVAESLKAARYKVKNLSKTNKVDRSPVTFEIGSDGRGSHDSAASTKTIGKRKKKGKSAKSALSGRHQTDSKYGNTVSFD